MSPNCFLLPFLFLFSLSSSVQGGLKVIPSTYFDGCPSYDCGDGVKVIYPFWVRNHSANSFCGYPTFEVTCEGGKPSITTNSGSYIVRLGNQYRNNLRVVDSEVVGQRCPRASHNVTFGNKLLYLANSRTNLVFCFNNGSVPNQPPKVVGETVFPINCLNDSKGSSSYVFKEAKADPPRLDVELRGSCPGGVVRSPVTRYDVWDQNLSTYFRNAINNGFEVEWKSPPGDCATCERSYGRCGYNNNTRGGLEFHCLCGPRGTIKNGSCFFDPYYVNPTWDVREGFVTFGIIVAISSPSLVTIIICLCKYWRSFTSKCFSNENNVEVFLNSQPTTLPVKRYRYKRVKKMTTAFNEKLGQGGYGTVYKGKLSDGSLVAVKLLTQTNGSGEEFINEVSSIGRTNHVNIVTLLGFCSEGSRRALIYEFMPNGSLDKFLFADDANLKTSLDWEKLQSIAIGIASGLEYLHRGCKTPVVHFDIKPHNILLDEDLRPKISDFGLAKICKHKESILSMACARGTIGYIAPEVFSRNFGTVSSKSDVYSYGMMILEMVGRRRNVNQAYKTTEVYFPHWIYDHLDEYCHDLQETECAVDSIKGENPEIARKMALVGLWCIQTSPTSRPSISKVVEMLKGDSENLAIPPKPYICSPERSGRNNIENIPTFTLSSSG